jgi:pyruvate dehydrogenase E1 component beta subunit
VLNDQEPERLVKGQDITVIANSFSCLQAKRVIKELEKENYSIELIDLRILNPLKYDVLVNSVKKTGRLLTIDGGWTTCGMAGEIIAGITEKIDPSLLLSRPVRLTLTDAPAPTSKHLEKEYYLDEEKIKNTIIQMLE